MTVLAYKRLSFYAPPERELLEVQPDGTFTMWRSISPVIGRFAGVVPDVASLSKLVAAAKAEALPAAHRPEPDASVETIRIGSREARFPADKVVRGAWGRLAEACRVLIDELRAQPVAGIALGWDGGVALRLRHVGAEPLPIELGAAVIEVDAYRGTALVSSARVGVPSAGSITTRDGWNIDVALPAMPFAAGCQVSATVKFVVKDAGVYVPVALSVSRLETSPETSGGAERRADPAGD